MEAHNNKQVPEDCYDCWINHKEDYCDGVFCEILGRKVKWFVDRNLKPKDCPMQ